MSKRAWWSLVLVVACARGEGTPTDTTAIVETEPDIVTAEDSLAPEPALPAFQLIGTEPFWGLRIDSTGMTFTTPVDTAGERFSRSMPVMVGDTLRWNSLDNAGREIEALVITGTCSDGMSDKQWTHRARVTIGRDRYEGCAERRP